MRRYNKIIICILFLILASGSVQAWQINANYTDFASTKTFNNVYYNNESFPKIYYVSVKCTSGTDEICYQYLNINSSTITTKLDTNIASGQKVLTFFTFIVPSHVNYSISYLTIYNSNYEIVNWFEWDTIDIGGDIMDLTNTLLLIISVSMLFIVIYILYKELVR